MLTARQRRRLNGWVATLAIDLPTAQAILRLPADRWPDPPVDGEPVWSHGWYDDELLGLPSPPWPAEVPRPAGAGPETPPPPSVAPRGAYARRARSHDS